MDRMGVRLRLRQAQADAGDIALPCADKSEALTHLYHAHAHAHAHAWAERGADLRVQAPGQSKKVAVNRHPMLTPDRRPKLTLSGRC